MENRLVGLSNEEILTEGRGIITNVRDEVRKVVYGEELEYLIELLTIASLVDGGHVLVEAPVGFGKTTALDAFARAIGGRFNKIQCRPDMRPSAFSGFEIYNQKTREFEVRHGPFFGVNSVMVDEINRATPKALAALLEIMAEHRITIGAEVFPLEAFLRVIATRNPIELEGVFPLPEALLDRFLFQVVIREVSGATIAAILDDPEIHRSVKVRLARVEVVTNPAELLTLSDAIFATIYADKRIRNYIVRLWEAVNAHKTIGWQSSPRGPINLRNASRVIAYLNGMDYVGPEHVRRCGVEILAHRFFMDPEHRYDPGRDMSPEDIVREVLDHVNPDHD